MNKQQHWEYFSSIWRTASADCLSIIAEVKMAQFTKEEIIFAIAALSGIKCCASTFITQIEDAVANQPDYGCNPEALLEKLEACSFEEKDEFFSKIEAICKMPGSSLPSEAQLKAVGLL